MIDPFQLEPEWLTVPEVALRLRVSRMTVYRMCESSEIPSYRIGRQLRIKTIDFETYISAARHQR